MSKLEAEAEEMRERIKKLAKFEKQEKGQSALNEELKKMEQETGISVSYLFFRVTGGVFRKRWPLLPHATIYGVTYCFAVSSNHSERNYSPHLIFILYPERVFCPRLE